MAVRYLVPEGNHLPVSDEDGKPDHRLMGAAWAALHGGYRGNKYEGPGKEEAIRKLKALYKSEGMEPPDTTPNSELRTGYGGFRLRSSELPRFVVRLADLGGSGTARIPLAITGEWVKNGREFAITCDDLDDVIENFTKKLNGEINVDYDHASEMPEVAAGGPVPSAGRILALGAPVPFEGNREAGVGNRENPESLLPAPDTRFILYGTYEPTERARQLIRNREYRYISPAIDWGARDKQTGKRQGTTMTSVALTNRPFLEELPEIRLSDPDYEEVGSRWKVVGGRRPTFHLPPTTYLNEGVDMSKKLSMAPCDDCAGIFDGSELVGLVPHAEVKKYYSDHLEEQGAADSQTATEAVRAAKAREALTKIFLAEKPDEDAVDALLAANQGRPDAGATLTELRRAERARKAIDAAMAAGKILPVDRAVAFSTAFGDPRGFDEWISKRPVNPRLGPPVGVAGSGLEGANARQQMAELVSAKREQLKREDPSGTASMNFSDLTARATQLVRKENPELFRRYREEQ
jgi:phage I-like protein